MNAIHKMKRGYRGRLLPQHGHYQTRVHNTWLQMRARCRNSSHQVYRHYGGRGIKVCARWDLFENFLADMGEQGPQDQLERINNDGDYEPSNCRWASHLEQMNNTSHSRRFEFNGKFLTVGELARLAGIRYNTMYGRLCVQNWTVQTAVVIPVANRAKKS